MTHITAASYDQFIDQVMERLGADDRAQIERTVHATLEALGERLDSTDARAVAEDLPGSLADSLKRRHADVADFDVDHFYGRVSELGSLRISQAAEEAQVVCTVLADSAQPETRAHLRHLPEAFAALFDPPERSRSVPPPHHYRDLEPGAGRTLATGRPGSHHPVSQSAPHRAHSESVAGSDHPHADSKLSTTHGKAEERRGESMATGKPGSTRPLSEQKPERAD